MVNDALCWDNTGSIAFTAVTAILSAGCSRFELYHGQWNMATSHGVKERSHAFKSFTSSSSSSRRKTANKAVASEPRRAEREGGGWWRC